MHNLYSQQWATTQRQYGLMAEAANERLAKMASPHERTGFGQWLSVVSHTALAGASNLSVLMGLTRPEAGRVHGGGASWRRRA